MGKLFYFFISFKSMILVDCTKQWLQILFINKKYLKTKNLMLRLFSLLFLFAVIFRGLRYFSLTRTFHTRINVLVNKLQ